MNINETMNPVRSYDNVGGTQFAGTNSNTPNIAQANTDNAQQIEFTPQFEEGLKKYGLYDYFKHLKYPVI